MSTFAWAAAMLVAAGYYFAVLGPQTTVSRDAPSAEAIAATMLVVQKAAVDWCLGVSGCPDGIVPLGQLTLPPGYVAAPWVAVRATGGWVSTYVSGVTVSAIAVAEKLGDRAEGGASSGVVSASQTVISRVSGQTGRVSSVVATGVPVGVPVISVKAK